MGHCDADMMATFPDEEIKLVAVADTNPEQMKDAPAGVETYNSIDEMLEKADIIMKEVYDKGMVGEPYVMSSSLSSTGGHGPSQLL